MGLFHHKLRRGYKSSTCVYIDFRSQHIRQLQTNTPPIPLIKLIGHPHAISLLQHIFRIKNEPENKLHWATGYFVFPNWSHISPLNPIRMFKKYAKIINRGFNSIGIGDILSQPDSNGYYEILLDEEKCISNLCHAYNHIIMAQEIEDIKRAERFLMEAEELDEENAQLYETFGIIYEKIDEEKASKYYYKGYELIVHNLKRYKYLIQCLESKGERQILREYNTHLLMLHIRSAILANKAGIDIDDVKIFNFAVQTISMYFHNIRTARLGEDEHGENEYINALCYVPVIKHVIDTCLRRYLPHIPHSRNEFMKIIKNEIINLIMSIDIDRFLGKAENFIALLDILGNRLKDQINKAITEQLNCMKKT